VFKQLVTFYFKLRNETMKDMQVKMQYCSKIKTLGFH